MKKIINLIIQKLGRTGYTIDNTLSNSDLILILFGRFMQILRGYMIKPFLESSKGLLFIGRNVKVKFKRKITVGSSVIIGDNVEINALSKSGIQIGNNVSILNGTIIECTGVIRQLGEGLTIGNNVGIAHNCFLQVRGRVIINDNVIVGPNVSIFSENHIYSDPDIPIAQQGEARIGVSIGSGAWLGTRSVILDGVNVGENSIVAAGSIVTKDVPKNSIVAGIPAKVIKNRK